MTVYRAGAAQQSLGNGSNIDRVINETEPTRTNRSLLIRGLCPGLCYASVRSRFITGRHHELLRRY